MFNQTQSRPGKTFVWYRLKLSQYYQSKCILLCHKFTKRTLLYETEIRSASREEDNNFTGEPSSPEQENNQLAE